MSSLLVCSQNSLPDMQLGKVLCVDAFVWLL